MPSFVGFTLKSLLLMKKGRIVLGPDEDSRLKLITWQLGNILHQKEAIQVEMWLSKDLKLSFTRKEYIWQSKALFRTCEICQSSKYDNAENLDYYNICLFLKKFRLMWALILSHYCLTHMVKTVIFVVIDRLSKYDI